MKIAILYICTGKYNQFFEGFYQSCERYFLVDKAHKEYFVFTDNMNLSTKENVHLFYKECKGFPLDSLFRFDMFLSIKEKISDFDYSYYFNANMIFVENVGEEFLPHNSDFTAVIHPGEYRRPAILFPYERNKKSTAYIPPFRGPYTYYMGSLNGGRTNAFLNFAEECSKNIHIDYNNGIIADVHDESHLNHYIHFNGGEGLHPMYAYPENWNLPFKPKIILRDKEKFDPYFTKGRNHSFYGKIVKGVKMLYRAIIWFL